MRAVRRQQFRRARAARTRSNASRSTRLDTVSASGPMNIRFTVKACESGGGAVWGGGYGQGQDEAWRGEAVLMRRLSSRSRDNAAGTATAQFTSSGDAQHDDSDDTVQRQRNIMHNRQEGAARTSCS